MPKRIASIADRAALNWRSIRAQLRWACAAEDDDWHETLYQRLSPVDADAGADVVVVPPPGWLSLCSVALLLFLLLLLLLLLSAATSIANCLVLALALLSLIRFAAAALTRL